MRMIQFTLSDIKNRSQLIRTIQNNLSSYLDLYFKVIELVFIRSIF